MQNLSVTRMGTLWQMWDGDITYPSPMMCELRERLDVPTDPTISFSWGWRGELSYWDNNHSRQIVRYHEFGGVCEDCILAPNGVWYHLNVPGIKWFDGAWYATWTGWRNDNLALMLNSGFWAYRSFMPIRWLIKNIYRRTRYAIIERLNRLDMALHRRGWRP